MSIVGEHPITRKMPGKGEQTAQACDTCSRQLRVGRFAILTRLRMHFWSEKYFQTLNDIAAEFNILERFTSSMGRYVRNQPDEGDGAAKRVVGAPPRARHLLQFSAPPQTLEHRSDLPRRRGKFPHRR